MERAATTPGSRYASPHKFSEPFIEAELHWHLGQPPKFLSEIFYLTLAMNHYGLQKTISTLDELAREHNEIARHIEQLQGDGSWQGVSFHLLRRLLFLVSDDSRRLYKLVWSRLSTLQRSVSMQSNLVFVMRCVLTSMDDRQSKRSWKLLSWLSKHSSLNPNWCSVGLASRILSQRG